MKKALGIILITTLLLGIASTIATLIQPKEQPLKITLPLAPGDKLVYQVTIYIIENGTLTPITNKTVEITIEKLGWPLTNTSIGEIPTSQLLIPPQLVYYTTTKPNMKLDLPIYSYYLSDYACTWYKPTAPGRYDIEPYSGCKNLIAYARVSENGLVEAQTIDIPLEEGRILREQAILTAIVSSGKTTTIQVDTSEAMICTGAFSSILRYASPGAYLINGTTIRYLGVPRGISDIPVLILDKSPESARIWGKLVNLEVKVDELLVFIRSPLGIALPAEYTNLRPPALILPSGVVVEGADNVLKELSELRR